MWRNAHARWCSWIAWWIPATATAWITGKVADWGAFDWQHAADRMAEYGFKEAIVTLGGDGSVVLDTAAPEGQRIVCIAPVKVDAVDTTVCGDSFMGTVLAGLASGFSLQDAARLASYVSAYAATGYGAQASYGTAAQIRSMFS